MGTKRFDSLVRVFAAPSSRRSLVRFLATLPLLSGVFSQIGVDDVDANGRRKRRKKRHKHGKGRHRGKGKKSCKARSTAKTCAGICGSVKNNCRKTVDCGPCACDPACGECQECAADGTCGACAEACCDGTCATEASLEAACPAGPAGFLTYPDGSMRCAAGNTPACACLGVYRDCAPGTACRMQGSSVICDWPQG